MFVAAFLFASIQLLGWSRTWRFWLISFTTAFVCEYSSTRTGIPFGWYNYNGLTVGQELYISNIPFMATISFSYLLYAAYCLTHYILSPSNTRRPPDHPSCHCDSIWPYGQAGQRLCSPPSCLPCSMW